MRCDWPSCKKESFSNKDHFIQHLYHHRDGQQPTLSAQVHASGLVVNLESPESYSRPFGDNLLDHIKAGHDPPKCTFDHCDFRSLGHVMLEHRKRVHGDYWECKLLGCEGSTSRFQYERFGTHLLNNHDIFNMSLRVMRAAAGRGDIRVLPRGTIVTCKHCSKKRAQSNENKVSQNRNVLMKGVGLGRVNQSTTGRLSC